MLFHQGIGLRAFNRLPTRRCVHALYECCGSVAMAAELARTRPYGSRSALFSRAEDVLLSLPQAAVDDLLQAYPGVGSRPRSGTGGDAAAVHTVLRTEIATLNRSRLERMLGPEGGYDNWS